MPTITVSFTPLPVHVRTARLVALATARRLGVDDELLDEIRFAVGEACSRAVGINAVTGDPVVMTLADGDQFVVEVRDVAQDTGTVDDLDPAAFDVDRLAVPEADPSVEGGLGDALPSGFGLAIISGLVEDFSVSAGTEGTTVRLTWPVKHPIDPASS